MLSRRSFLVSSAGLVGATALGGCSGSSAPANDATNTPQGEMKGKTLVAYFADGNQGPGSQRLAFGLAAETGAILTTGGPAKLTARVIDQNGAIVVPKIEAARHGEGLPRPYWPFELTLTTPGIYTLDIQGATAAFTVASPEKLEVPVAGQRLPTIDTPTTAATQGVNPICTRNPACPFHTVSLREALAVGKPIVLLVGTPAHCKTAVCGPVLEHLIESQKSFGDKATVIHAEVYQDDSINDITQAMLSLRLRYEPVLFVANSQGVITRRLDNVWDLAEQRAALTDII